MSKPRINMCLEPEEYEQLVKAVGLHMRQTGVKIAVYDYVRMAIRTAVEHDLQEGVDA